MSEDERWREDRAEGSCERRLAFKISVGCEEGKQEGIQAWQSSTAQLQLLELLVRRCGEEDASRGRRRAGSAAVRYAKIREF